MIRATWRRLAAVVAVVALAGCVLGCRPSATPTSSGSTPQSQPPVIHLPTQLPVQMGFADTLPLFEYDRTAPLDVQEVASYPRGGSSLDDITYMGANGRRVPAYVVTPAGKGPFAGAIFMGWTGDYSAIRKEFVDEAMSLADRGVVSVLVSGYFPWLVKPLDEDADRMAMIGQVRELRRAIDLLAAQPVVDSSRIAFVGHSMGAMHGAVLAAVDHRIKAAVLMAPHSTWTDWIFEGYGLDAQTETEYRAAMVAFDPITYVGHANPTALFFQFSNTDQFVPSDVAQTLYDTASEPKKIGWYNGGHDLDDAAWADRTAWLSQELNLTS